MRKILRSGLSAALLLGLLLSGISCTQTSSVTPTPSAPLPSEPIPTPALTATPVPSVSPSLAPTTGVTLQEGNNFLETALQPKDSREIEDNRIGTSLGSYEPGYANTQVVYPIGFKWIHISFSTDPLNWQYVETKLGEYTIDPACDRAITEYAGNGTKIVLNLGVGSWENRLDVTRFKSQEDVDRYCGFARFMVGHFKDRIEYYEIWNEPGDIDVQDYANLIKHVVPVIREEYPGAKIVIGATHGDWATGYPGYGDSGRFTLAIDYLKTLLRSGVAPIVDGISWHPFYGNRPDDPYYRNYPQMVQQIKELATSEGFRGDYFADEIVWRTAGDNLDPQIQRVSEIVAAKYFLRSIVMHRGLATNITIGLPGAHDPTLQKVQAIHNLCDLMAGAEPTDLPVEIQGEIENIRTYSFSLPNGDKLVALWTDDVAVDNDPGIEATVTLPDFSAEKVTGIDVLHGFEQELATSIEDGSLVIHNLLIKDYPVIIRLSD